MPWRFVSRKASNCGIGPQVPKILRSINRSALARLNDVRSMSDGMTGWIKTRIGRGAESRWTLAAALALTMQFAPHAGLARPAGIAPSVDASDDSDDDALPYVQCVPFARQASGIQLYGDALNWWDQADGHYARGHVVTGTVLGIFGTLLYLWIGYHLASWMIRKRGIRRKWNGCVQ